MAKMLTNDHASPVGGRALPAKDAVIHMKVVPNRNRPKAKTFLKLHISCPLQRANLLIASQSDLPERVDTSVNVVLRLWLHKLWDYQEFRAHPIDTSAQQGRFGDGASQ
jgi:hypothetical protein